MGKLRRLWTLFIQRFRRKGAATSSMFICGSDAFEGWLPPAPTQRGWFLSDPERKGRRKWHYFNRNYSSMCRVYEFPDGLPDGLVDKDDANPNRCATCRNKVTRMHQREARNDG